MPVRATPDQATQKWVSNLGAATARMTTGAQGVTKAPGAAAAAAKAKWLQRVTASADKFATNVGRVTLQQWQDAYINIGIPRVAAGAQAKQGKMQDFMSEFLPFLQNGVAKIDAMPSTSLEDNIARATAMIRYNATFKRRGGS